MGQSVMKILNLYSGIGGNRKFWQGHEVTAVELDEKTADVYEYFFPRDTVIRGDAHQYLLDHFKEFDLIWSSPPCQTHSQLNIPLHSQGYIRYPDMKLYQEILFLQQWGGRDGRKWIVENVTPYYKPLIPPRVSIHRHLIWSNFEIDQSCEVKKIGNMMSYTYKQLGELLDMPLPVHLLKGVDSYHRRLMLRDIVRPEIGEHILKAAENIL